MKPGRIKRYFFAIIAGLCCESTAFAEIINGGLENIGNTPPSAVKLNLIYITMDATMTLVAEYTDANNACPPPEYFEDNTQSGLYISNGSSCDVVVKLGRNVPGALQNKTIRMVVKSSGAYPSPAEFGIRQVITNIDYGSNGVDQTFLLRQAPAYTWSHTLQGSSFGNAASAGINNVLHDSYETIASNSEAVNTTSTGTAGGNGTKTSNIQ